MSRPLTTTVTGDGALARQHRAVLAAVPDRLRAVPAGGDVTMVAASAPGWTTQLVEAIRGGARGALVVGTGSDDSAENVRAAGLVARDAGAVVLVDRPCAMDRAWRQVAADWRRDAAQASLLDSTAAVVADGLDHALLEQLALVRAAVGGPDRLDAVHRSEMVYQIAGHAASVRISLSGTRARESVLSMDLVGAGTRRTARFAPTGLTVPARITTFDRTGARTEPPWYESGHRAAWLELHDAVRATDGPRVRPDLELLAEDLEWVYALLGSPDHTT